jgi:signal transduction histidine kinase
VSEATVLGGWLLAAVALAGVAIARRSLATRMETVARACHELRGPLTAARLGLELGARCGELSDSRLRAVDLELGRASLALEDLCGAPRRRRTAQRGGSEVPGRPVEHVDVERLLADSVEASRASAAARGVELRMVWSGGPAVVVGERLRLAQATGNLIANAIEHGGGAVEVRGAGEPSGVRIEVIDGGPGLGAPVAELARGRRAPRGPRGRRWGRGRRRGHAIRARGHGLAVAGAVAAAHSGRLASAPSERGARIVLELPAAAGGRLSAPADA